MDDATLQIILGRFDKLDSKIDAIQEGQSLLAQRVTAVETKVEPLAKEASFEHKVDYIKTGLAGTFGAGIVLAAKSLFHR